MSFSCQHLCNGLQIPAIHSWGKQVSLDLRREIANLDWSGGLRNLRAPASALLDRISERARDGGRLILNPFESGGGQVGWGSGDHLSNITGFSETVLSWIRPAAATMTIHELANALQLGRIGDMQPVANESVGLYFPPEVTDVLADDDGELYVAINRQTGKFVAQRDDFCVMGHIETNLSDDIVDRLAAR